MQIQLLIQIHISQLAEWKVICGSQVTQLNPSVDNEWMVTAVAFVLMEANSSWTWWCRPLTSVPRSQRQVYFCEFKTRQGCIWGPVSNTKPFPPINQKQTNKTPIKTPKANKLDKVNLGMALWACNFSIQEAEAGELPQVGGQLRLRT